MTQRSKAVQMPLDNKEAMLSQLYQYCSINSGSGNLSGLATMLEQLSSDFSSIADTIKIYPMPQVPLILMTGEQHLQSFGNALFIQKRPHLKRRVLLCGHMDTVYGPEHPFQQLKMIDNNTLNGPGVADMKGGLVVMLHALKAFEQTKHASQLGWDVLINADEELGSLASAQLMTQLAPAYQAALVYEPSMTPDGTLAKNRKGNGKVTLVATGVAAHAGRDFMAGRNAICYLANVITAIHHLNDQREGVTLNIGKIAGGTSLNTVPDNAVAKIDVRISFAEDEQWVRNQLNIIQKNHELPGYTLLIDAHFDRPVKRINAATEQLFTRLQSIGRAKGINLEWKDSGGCCDGNNLAQHGLAVLDTLGVRGGKIHTADEYILIDSLVERATLSALLLADLAQGSLEQL